MKYSEECGHAYERQKARLTEVSLALVPGIAGCSNKDHAVEYSEMLQVLACVGKQHWILRLPASKYAFFR
jgi:hypothetical protein